MLTEETGVTLGLMIAILGGAASAIWVVATIRQVVASLRDSMRDLTRSVDRLSIRIEELESEHAATRERIATLEGRL